MSQLSVDFGDSVKVTAAGFIHLRVLGDRLEYLYAILTVTPITESQTAWQVAEFLKRENQEGHLSGFQQVRAVEAFLAYLRTQFARLKAAYPEFGHERAGASFVMMQIESAVQYFKNPMNPRHGQNYLDD